MIQETAAPPGHVEIVHERINALSTGGSTAKRMKSKVTVSYNIQCHPARDWSSGMKTMIRMM